MLAHVPLTLTADLFDGIAPEWGEMPLQTWNVVQRRHGILLATRTVVIAHNRAEAEQVALFANGFKPKDARTESIEMIACEPTNTERLFYSAWSNQMELQ